VIFWGVSIDATLGAEAGAVVEIGEPSATGEGALDCNPAAGEGFEDSQKTKTARTSVTLFILMREYRRNTGPKNTTL
jgi:hypothetical protein